MMGEHRGQRAPLQTQLRLHIRVPSRSSAAHRKCVRKGVRKQTFVNTSVMVFVKVLATYDTYTTNKKI